MRSSVPDSGVWGTPSALVQQGLQREWEMRLRPPCPSSPSARLLHGARCTSVWASGTESRVVDLHWTQCTLGVKVLGRSFQYVCVSSCVSAVPVVLACLSAGLGHLLQVILDTLPPIHSTYTGLPGAAGQAVPSACLGIVSPAVGGVHAEQQGPHTAWPLPPPQCSLHSPC